MSEPQQPYGPPPGQPGQRDPSGYGPAPLGPGWPSGPVAGAYTGPTETEAKAVVALVLAVLAYTPMVPFIGAVAALVLARLATRDIDRAGGAKTGRGLVRAARVLAWVHLVFVGIFLIVLAVLLAVGAGVSVLGL